MDEQKPSSQPSRSQPQPPSPQPQVQPPPYWQSAPIQYNPFSEVFRVIKAMFWSASLVSFLILFIISMAIVFAYTPAIQDWITTPGQDGLLPSDAIFVITPIPVGFAISGFSFQAWHILVLAILLICFAYCILELFTAWNSKKGNAVQALTMPEKAVTGLESVAKLLMAITFFSVVYYMILGTGGVEPGTPDLEDMPIRELIYRLFSASVFEEIAARVLLIGVPLLFIALILRWKGQYRSLLLGGRLKLNMLTLGLIVFSSMMFAFAHALSWDFWKVPQVFVSGMALGYAFIHYGLYASILLHFSVNVVTNALIQIWPDDVTITMVVGLILLLWFFAGAYFLLDYFIRFVTKFREIINTTFAPAPVTASAQTDRAAPTDYQVKPTSVRAQSNYSLGYGGLVCQHCGSTSATYEDKKLVCMRCKNVIVDNKDQTQK
jgi:hypothetical protein